MATPVNGSPRRVVQNGTPRPNKAPRPAPAAAAPAPPAPIYKARSPQQRNRARQQKVVNRTTNRTKTKQLHIHVNKGSGGGSAASQGGMARQASVGDAQFYSASDVREFAERGRRIMREASMDLAYAAETLRAVLRSVPPAAGQNNGQAFIRAARTARNLKRAATAAAAASAHCARLWPAYLREYAPELSQYGGPRNRTRANGMNFGR